MILAKLMFLANVLLAGWISFNCMLNPLKAKTLVFEDAFQYSESLRLVGCLWFGIFLLSVFGLFFTEKMNLVFLFQFIYKSTWLILVVLPAQKTGANYPKGMATCFVIWVLILPFVIEWKKTFTF